MKDEIIEQVWEAKDQLMRECDHDLGKPALLLRHRQQERKHVTVDLTKDRAAGPQAKV